MTLIEVFEQPRTAMRIALPQTDKGLNDGGNETDDIQSIKQRVTKFWHSKTMIDLAKSNKDYQKMLKQIDKYWDKLFADPIEVQTPQRKMFILSQRTNNSMEQFFREWKRRGRKKSITSGRPSASLARSFKAMIANTPLINNLENPQYTRILLKETKSSWQRFAQIDVKLVREEMKKNEEQWRDLPKGFKKMLKMSDLPQKLFRQTAK